MGTALPVELGGQGLGLRSYAHVAEAEGASDHGPAALGSASLLDALMLARHGSPRVRERYLAPLVAGELRASYAMTEQDAPGTDPFLTATRAAETEDGWRLTGDKWFVSGGDAADLVTVLARTDGQPPEREGLSLLLVPTASPGFRVVRELPVLGAAGQAEIALDGVAVDADHLIGERGKALAVAAERLQLGRTLRCLRWLGQAGRAFDLMRERAVTRSRPAPVVRSVSCNSSSATSSSHCSPCGRPGRWSTRPCPGWTRAPTPMWKWGWPRSPRPARSNRWPTRRYRYTARRDSARTPCSRAVPRGARGPHPRRPRRTAHHLRGAACAASGAGLAVLFGQVGDAAGWWVAADAGVGPVVVVPVQPVGKRSLPVGVSGALRWDTRASCGRA